MINRRPSPPFPANARIAQPVAAPAMPVSVPLAEGGSDAGLSGVGRLLARLLAEESALYAITRDWRFDVAGRKFVRLREVLDEQFSEIGGRLDKLAKRSRALGCWASTGHGDGVAVPRGVVADDRLEEHMIRELLGRHAAMLTSLRAGQAQAAGDFHDRTTAEVLVELIAGHEKDAFMLRALLWEVQNPST